MTTRTDGTRDLARMLLACAVLAAGCGRLPASRTHDADVKDAAPDGALVSGSGLTLSRIFDDPPLDGVSIRSPAWSGDGSKLGWLRSAPDNRDVLELWAWEAGKAEPGLLVRAADLVDPGREALSDAQVLALERKRITERGITSFTWSPDGSSVLLPLGGSLHVFDVATRKSLVLDDGTRGVPMDPRFSPDGSMVAFVREGDLWVASAAGGEERQLTRGATDTLTHGLAEFVAQEEMGRYRGFWWSPDSTRIAFLEVDESGVEVWRRASYGAGESFVTEQRYPGAGRPNAVVRPGILTVETGKVTWVDLAGDEQYVARVDWAPDGSAIALELQPRSQKRLDLVMVDAEDATTRVVLSETSDTFVNLHDDLHLLADGRFVWSSEKTGTRQVYLHEADGSQVAQLTSLELPVMAVHAVDEKSGTVLFSAAVNRGLECQVFSVPLSGGDVTALGTEPGWHSIEASPDGRHYLDSHSTAMDPPRSAVHDATGTKIAVIEPNPTEELSTLLTTRPELTTVTAADGVTELSAMYIKPPDFDPKKRYPVVIYGYGGPHGHLVADRWTRSSLFSHYLAQQGFVVFSVDPRGAAARGKAFEDEIHQRFGVVEVQDHAEAARHLARLSWVDPERIGIWGWSYGGYLTIMSLVQTSDLYRCGIAVAPVTDWHFYDSHYTERYMGMPDTSAAAYEKGSVLLADPAGLTEDLLIVHGMADDNVFLRHSLSFVERLQDAGVQFDLMLYPGKTHLIAGKGTRKHLYTMMYEFWVRHMGSDDAR